MNSIRSLLLALILFIFGEDRAMTAAETPGPALEPEFPFHGSVVDARSSVPGLLVPRGLVLHVGKGNQVCFDPDLLRVAAVWHTEEAKPFLSLDAMSTNSYAEPAKKVPAGQKKLPKPNGRIFASIGPMPGWGEGTPALADPRKPGRSAEEKGLGPIHPALGRWEALELHDGRPVLIYRVGETAIVELWQGLAGSRVTRDLLVETTEEPLFVAISKVANDAKIGPRKITEAERFFQIHPGSFSGASFHHEDGVLFLRIPPHRGQAHIRVTFGKGSPVDFDHEVSLAPVSLDNLGPSRPGARLWKENVSTSVLLGIEDRGGYVLDDITLPFPNPWNRRVRIADIAFLDTQRTAIVTFDGDVWIGSGLGGFSAEVRWSRFASGLHEPKSLVAVEGILYVFDRAGIWRLLDVDGNGEVDRYENFCNLFTQTAETREFAMGMDAHPEGGFVIAKGGQSASTLARERGTLIRVSTDGTSYKVLARGLRQPYVGVDPLSGAVAASDQQGNFIPTTPVHLLRPGLVEDHGFLPAAHPRRKEETRDAAKPLVWIPHPVNQSGANPMWVRGSRLGALEGSLVHLGYNKPEVFRVLPDSREGLRQGGVVEVLNHLPGPVLNGSINPRDGWLYVAGFEIWGGSADRLASLLRVRPGNQKPAFLVEALAGKRGVLLRFDEPIGTESAVAGNASAERWNYRRSASYGSAHYRLDGKPGQEFLPIASARLSSDQRSIFLGIPDMQPTHTLRISVAMESEKGEPVEETIYLTVRDHPKLELIARGFNHDEVDLTPTNGRAARSVPKKPTIAEGKRIAGLMGCVACHATRIADDEAKVGPAWKGAFGTERELEQGGVVRLDETYLRESILRPEAKVGKGFSRAGVGMPSYEGILEPWEIDSIILFIRSLGPANQAL